MRGSDTASGLLLLAGAAVVLRSPLPWWPCLRQDAGFQCLLSGGRCCPLPALFSLTHPQPAAFPVTQLTVSSQVMPDAR